MIKQNYKNLISKNKMNNTQLQLSPKPEEIFEDQKREEAVEIELDVSNNKEIELKPDTNLRKKLISALNRYPRIFLILTLVIANSLNFLSISTLFLYSKHFGPLVFPAIFVSIAIFIRSFFIYINDTKNLSLFNYITTFCVFLSYVFVHFYHECSAWSVIDIRIHIGILALLFIFNLLCKRRNDTQLKVVLLLVVFMELCAYMVQIKFDLNYRMLYACTLLNFLCNSFFSYFKRFDLLSLDVCLQCLISYVIVYDEFINDELEYLYKCSRIGE